LSARIIDACDDPIGFEEHVLGAAQADPFGTELAGPLAVGGRIGVGANASVRNLSAHSISLAKSPDSFGSWVSTDPSHHFAGRAVEADRVFAGRRSGRRR
jgi:hypothetical protein